MIKEKLAIHKQYLVISAPVEFSLIANNGTDKVLRSAGVWQLDCHKLLPEKYMANYPVFNLELEYDETKIPEGFAFEYYFTNINLGDSLKGVSGDLVELSEYQFGVIQKMLSYSEDFPDYVVVAKGTTSKINESFDTSSYKISSRPQYSKVLYFGTVLVLNDGTRHKTSTFVVNNQPSISVFHILMTFFYRLFVDVDNKTKVHIRNKSTNVHTYNDGILPDSSVVSSAERIEKLISTNEHILISDISSIEFYLLTDK